MDVEPEQIYVKPEINIEVEIEPFQESNVEIKNSMPIKTEPLDTDFKEFNANSNRDSQSVLSPNQETSVEITPKRKIEIEGKVYENGKINRVQCPQCNNTFKNRANLKTHIKFVHSSEDDVVDCNICFRTFKSLLHLRSHKTSVHGEEKEVACDYCDKTFLNKKKLNNHIFYCHPDSEENVNCEVCSKVFKTKYRLKVHMKQVHPEGQTVTCHQCLKEFKNSMLLQRHVKWAHPTDGLIYRCQQCGRVLPSIDGYKRHMAIVHGARNVSCEVCSKTFKTNGSLNRHMVTVHSTVKVERKKYKQGDLQCSDCDKKFATNTALLWHYEKFHSDNKLDAICQICCKEFCDMNSLKRHMETVHSEQSATCNICFKVYKSPMNLQRHIRVTHAPPEAAKSCDICQKTFKCLMHLKIHNNVVHSKEGEFACDICNKVYSSKKYMMKHKKTHNSKEYPCSICPKFFKSTNDVTRHIRRVHLKNGDPVLDQDDSTQENSTNGDTTCSKCGQMFVDETQLHAHIVNCGVNHLEEPDLIVPDKHSDYAGFGLLQQNSQIISEQIKKEPKDETDTFDSNGEVCCTKCGQVFDNDTELHSHIMNCGDRTTIKIELEEMN